MKSLALNITGAAPVLTYASTAVTGGTLTAATTYFYRVSAIMAYGSDGVVVETLAVAQGAGQLTGAGNLNTVTITWTAVPGATGYKVYGRLTGAPFLIATLGNVLTFTDTGATAYPLSTTAPLGASTFLAGNAFAPGAGGSFVAASPATPDLRTAIAGSAVTPFMAGQLATVFNPTGGTITLNLSPDNVTFGAAGYIAIAVLSDTFKDITLPNYLYASAAGAYLVAN